MRCARARAGGARAQFYKVARATRRRTSSFLRACVVWHAVRLAALSLSNLSVYPADDIALMNGARTVFASDATGRAAARAQQDYRRGLLASHTDGTGSPPRRIRPPMGARLCDEILFGSHIARHGADIGGGAPSGTQRRGLMAPSFFMLVPTCLMGTIAQTTLTP
eukprot:COSAG02_NODE_12096_length_1598_cov_1.323549_1_plen_164_part_10